MKVKNRRWVLSSSPNGWYMKSPRSRFLMTEKCWTDRKSTRLNSSHPSSSYAVFCLKEKKRVVDRGGLNQGGSGHFEGSGRVGRRGRAGDVSSFRGRCAFLSSPMFFSAFFFNDAATTEIYTLSLHDALPIYDRGGPSLMNPGHPRPPGAIALIDRKSTRLNSSHPSISYAVFCLPKNTTQ